MKRAQIAMEFLTTYGWALLIVLSAIGAFSYFIGVNPASKIPASCNLGVEFGCGSYIANQQGIMVYEFTNLIGETINLTNIEIKLPNGRREVIEYDFIPISAGETVTACTYSPNEEIPFSRNKERMS